MPITSTPIIRRVQPTNSLIDYCSIFSTTAKLSEKSGKQKLGT